MEIYVFALVWTILLGPITRCKFFLRKYNFEGRNLYLILVFIVYFLIMALRAYTVGSDTLPYHLMFNLSCQIDSWTDIENEINVGSPLFTALLYVSSRIFDDSQSFIAICDFIICFGFYLFIRRNTTNVVMACLLFLCLGFMFNSMNGARQMMSIAILVNSFYYFKKGIFNLKGWILVVGAILIHITSVFYLIGIGGMYILNRAKKVSKAILVMAIVLICIIVFLNSIINIIISFYPHYTMYLNGEAHSGVFDSSGEGRIILLYLGYLLVYVLYYIKLIWYKGSIRNIDYESVMALICVVLGIIFSRNILFNRLMWDFAIFMVIFIPDVYNLYKSKAKITLYLITSILVIILYFIQIVLNTNDIIPYQFFFS